MLEIRPLTPTDLSAALRLSTQAGWNQIEADWRRLINLWPASCLAGWHDGRLVATGTLATYGHELGWIGMILVDESCRGRGFGGAILDTILIKADELGVATLGLDATELGRPVYLKRGFIDGPAINRWVSEPGETRGVAGHTSAATLDVDTRTVPLTPAVCAWDGALCGVDRAALLQHLQAELGARGRMLIGPRGEPRAAAIVRLGRVAEHIAPVVAETPQDAAELVELIVNAEPLADRRLYIDALAHRAFEKELSRMGFVVQRRLTRMIRPSVVPALSTGRVFAAAGLDLG